MKDKVAERFIDEKLASHWQVDETEASFKELLEHIELNTNFKPYFEEAIKAALAEFTSKDLIIYDIGSGVSWTSAIMAKMPQVKHVYAIEPSKERLKHAGFVARHFKAPAEKLSFVPGTFTDYQLKEKADLIVYCGSIHHCYNKDMDALFARAKKELASEGVILVANEHYVTPWFTFRRFASVIKNALFMKKVPYSLVNPRAPHPYDGEHWRTKAELEKIFQKNGFKAEYFVFDGDLCKESKLGPSAREPGYHYYYAILRRKKMNVPLSNPDITEKEIQAVVSVLKTPDLSLGPKLREFEGAFADYLGVKHAIALNSGTSGLHLAIRSLNIKDGDEVITTPFSFISSANCMLFERARPIFVDIDPATYNIDIRKIEEKINKRTKALLPVHVFGYPCGIEKIEHIAKQYKLAVIEDACEAVGAEINGRKVGTFGDCSILAFYPNKQMTTGEGGLLATDNDEIAGLASSMRNQGRDAGMEWLAHSRLGFNYRLSDINCALGIVQLKRINEILAKRQKVAEYYAARLSQIPEIVLPPLEQDGVKRSWFVYVVRLTQDFSPENRNEIIKRMRARGIGCNCYFPPIHLQPFYRSEFGYKKGDFPITEAVAERTIALPFFNRLKEEDIDLVVRSLKNLIEEVKK